MTWKRVDVNHNPEGTPWVKMGCHGRAGGYAQVKVTLSRTYAEHLGISPGDKLELYRGTDDHAGWIGLVKGAEGFVVTDYRQGHGTLSFRCSSRWLGVEGRHPTVKIEGDSVVVDRWPEAGPLLYVELPAWVGGEA